MVLAVDVQYRDETSYVAGVVFYDWTATEPRGDFRIPKLLKRGD